MVSKTDILEDRVDMWERGCIEQAMDEYAKEVGIDFSRWCCEGLWTSSGGMWYPYRDEDNAITGEQLFELYINQNSNYMWQKCPICNGTGHKPTSTGGVICETCNGEKIISEQSGKPPAKQSDKDQSIVAPKWIEEHNRKFGA